MASCDSCQPSTAKGHGGCPQTKPVVRINYGALTPIRGVLTRKAIRQEIRRARRDVRKICRLGIQLVTHGPADIHIRWYNASFCYLPCQQSPQFCGFDRQAFRGLAGRDHARAVLRWLFCHEPFGHGLGLVHAHGEWLPNGQPSWMAAIGSAEQGYSGRAVNQFQAWYGAAK